MDHPSDSTLDELASLFLTPPSPPATPDEPSVPAAAHLDPLGGPAPIKLSPKITAGRPSTPSPAATFGPATHDTPDEGLLELLIGSAPQTTAHDVQAPASVAASAPAAAHHDPSVPSDPSAPTDPAGPALRWTGHDEVDLTNPPRRAEPAQAVAEAVLLGNLPGMAGPWLTQYAQLLAQHQNGRRSVAVLHLDGNRLDLELIEPTVRHPEDDGNPATRAPGLRVPPGGYADRDLVDLLDQLCRTGPTPVGTILLHADPHHERAERLADFADWTLVSGADEAALAAAGQLMRSLLDQEPRVAATRLGLMVMGSDADASQRAAQRLSQDLAEQLDTAPQLVGYQQQMIPARCRILGSFEGIDAQWPQLTTWLASLQAPAAQPDQASPAAVAPAPAPRPAPAAATATPSTAAPAAARPALPPLETPVQVPAASHAPAAEPDLFELIDTHARTHASIPGGIALDARCPSAPHAQLALDATGRLHLLLRHDSATGDLPTPRETIVELLAVRTWARQHRQLLQLTERSRRFDADADPVLHLFTDRADLSVDLVSRLGSLLKLHLLRDVAVGSEHTWFCVPLSA